MTNLSDLWSGFQGRDIEYIQGRDIFSTLNISETTGDRPIVTEERQ